jgi:hypothetical protein
VAAHDGKVTVHGEVLPRRIDEAFRRAPEAAMRRV